MERIQYGVIGCGSHALKTHAIPNMDVPELELAAICDLSEYSVHNFASEVGGVEQHFFKQDEDQEADEVRAMFLQSHVGAVLIGTPDECHFDDLTASVKAGKHTFVEKPLAVNLEELQELPAVLQEASKNELVVSSCHPRRFDPPFMWLKDQLPNLRERLGEPIGLRFDFSYHKPVLNWKHQRGLLLDHANHEIDLANYLFGHSGFDATRLIDKYDRYQVTGMRDDGISFDFSGTRRLDTKRYPEWASIRFETGEVTIDTHKGFARTNDHGIGQETVEPIPTTDYEARGAATMKNFGEAILGLSECYLSPQDLYVNTAFSVMLTNQKTWRYDNRDIEVMQQPDGVRAVLSRWALLARKALTWS